MLQPYQRAEIPKGYPAEWFVGDDGYEYAPLRLPKGVTRLSASTRLAIESEFGGWELARLRVYLDGSRRALLRRKSKTNSESERS